MKFPFTAEGIPCIVHVTAWEPYVEAKISGPPDHCYTEEGGFGEWELLDRRGRPALGQNINSPNVTTNASKTKFSIRWKVDDVPPGV